MSAPWIRRYQLLKGCIHNREKCLYWQWITAVSAVYEMMIKGEWSCVRSHMFSHVLSKFEKTPCLFSHKCGYEGAWNLTSPAPDCASSRSVLLIKKYCIQNTTNAQDHATINAALTFFKCVQRNDQCLCFYRMPRSQRHHTDANDCTAAPLKITQVLLQLPPQSFIHHNFLQLDRQDTSFAQGTGSGQHPLSC